MQVSFQSKGKKISDTDLFLKFLQAKVLLCCSNQNYSTSASKTTLCCQYYFLYLNVAVLTTFCSDL